MYIVPSFSEYAIISYFLILEMQNVVAKGGGEDLAKSCNVPFLGKNT